MAKTYADMALELRRDLTIPEFYELCTRFLRGEAQWDRLRGVGEVWFYDRSALVFTEELDDSLSVRKLSVEPFESNRL